MEAQRTLTAFPEDRVKPSLKRAVSTGYYCRISSSYLRKFAKVIVSGNRPEVQKLPTAWIQARCDEGPLPNHLRWVKFPSDGLQTVVHRIELVDACKVFVMLQAVRHQADYDIGASFLLSRAKGIIDEATRFQISWILSPKTSPNPSASSPSPCSRSRRSTEAFRQKQPDNHQRSGPPAQRSTSAAVHQRSGPSAQRSTSAAVHQAKPLPIPLQVPPQPLLPLDRLEQRLKVPLPETLRPAPLDDLVKDGRPVLHRTRENL